VSALEPLICFLPEEKSLVQRYLSWLYFHLVNFLAFQCCQVLTSIHGHIRQKPRPFSKLSRPPTKNLLLHDISKHQKQ
jgi:hypothetical protein